MGRELTSQKVLPDRDHGGGHLKRVIIHYQKNVGVKHKPVLRLIEDYHSSPLSLDYIATALDIKNKGKLKQTLRWMEQEGYISFFPDPATELSVCTNNFLKENKNG
jgi:hypothetical protein